MRTFLHNLLSGGEGVACIVQGEGSDRVERLKVVGDDAGVGEVCLDGSDFESGVSSLGSDEGGEKGEGSDGREREHY